MRFRSKERGTSVKERAKNGMSTRAGSILFHILVLDPFFARLNLCSPSFLGLSLLRDQKPHGNACYACWAFVSLRRRRNLTSVSSVCEAAPISLFWAPNGLNELPEVRFEFPFILIGKSTMTLSTGQSWRLLKSWYTGGGPEQGFWRGFADGLYQSLASYVT